MATKQMRCWKCGNEMSVTSDMVAAMVKCPHCEANVSVPGELFDAPLAQTTALLSDSQAKHKSPVLAAILNLLIWGAGYLYLGRTWGLLILIPFCILMGMSCLYQLQTNTPQDVNLGEMFLINLPGIAMAYHAYCMAKDKRHE